MLALKHRAARAKESKSAAVTRHIWSRAQRGWVDEEGFEAGAGGVGVTVLLRIQSWLMRADTCVQLFMAAERAQLERWKF